MEGAGTGAAVEPLPDSGYGGGSKTSGPAAAGRFRPANPSPSSLPPTRPPYIPQFTAATQMILLRMKGESSGGSGGTSSVSVGAGVGGSGTEGRSTGGTTAPPQSTHSTITPGAEITSSSAYEDVKRRLVMGMTTSASMTLQMPAPSAPSPASSAAPPPPPALAPKAPSVPASAPPAKKRAARRPAARTKMSAIRRVSSGLPASGRKRKARPAASRRSAAAAAKRKPEPEPVPQSGGDGDGDGGEDGDDASSSSLSSLSELSSEDLATRDMVIDKTDASPVAPLRSQPALASESAPAAPATPKSVLPPPPPPLPPSTTTTKSGRHVQKPSTYNPAASTETAAGGSGRKRAQQQHQHHSKARTTEQALCKKCTRMHSPASNQMVFCDGCNDGWHQMCHEPWIGDDLVRHADRAWFCATCQAAKRPMLSNGSADSNKRQKTTTTAAAATTTTTTTTTRRDRVPAPRESWADRPSQQKRAYLSTLPRQELVGLLMRSLDAHPDLPIFPLTGGGGGGSAASSPRPTEEHENQQRPGLGGPLGLASNTAAAPLSSPTNGGQASPGKGRATGGGGGQRGQRGNAFAKGDESSSPQQRRKQQERQDGAGRGQQQDADPLEPPWPKPGKGLYGLLPPEEEDKALVGDADYEAFSVIIYDESGNKVEENGVRV